MVKELSNEPESAEDPNGHIEVERKLTHIAMFRAPGYAEIVKEHLLEHGIRSKVVESQMNGVTRLYVQDDVAERAEELVLDFEAPIDESDDEESFDQSKKDKDIPVKMGFKEYWLRYIWIVVGIVWIVDGYSEMFTHKDLLRGGGSIAIGIALIIFVIRRIINVRKTKKESEGLTVR